MRENSLAETHLVFGKPLTQGDGTVVPLARVLHGFGWGVGSGSQQGAGRGEGGGRGGFLRARSGGGVAANAFWLSCARDRRCSSPLWFALGSWCALDGPLSPLGRSGKYTKLRVVHQGKRASDQLDYPSPPGVTCAN